MERQGDKETERWRDSEMEGQINRGKGVIERDRKM